MNQYILLTALSLALLPALFIGHRWALRPIPLHFAPNYPPIVESRYNWRLGVWMLLLGSILLALSTFDVIPSLSRASLMILGAALLPAGAWLSIDRRVKLRIDPVGIQYSRWGHASLQWAEVDAIELRVFRGAPFMYVLPSPSAGLRTRISSFWSALGRISRLTRADEFSISSAALEHGAWQLYEVTRFYLAHRRPAA